MLPKGTVRNMLEHYLGSPKLRGEVARAFREFFDENDPGMDGAPAPFDWAASLFNEWFLFDFVLRNGRTPLEDFIAKNPLSLPEEAIGLYRALYESHAGLFEVKSIALGESLALKELRTGTRFRVREFSATFTLRKGDLFFGRVGKVGDRWELVGSDLVAVPHGASAAERWTGDAGARLTAKDVYEELTRWKR
jgi:hypothetical protein